MEYTLKEVEDFFKFKLLSTVPRKYIDDTNICCGSLEFMSLLKIAKSLKNIYEMIDDRDICIAVIYTYYALTLGEQTIDFITPKIYANYAESSKNVTELITNITTGDIEDENGVNISQKIRQFMLFGKGGKKQNPKKLKKNKTKKNKTKKNKTKKNKTKKNKTKKNKTKK
jgi:hypothetical protein